MSQKNRNEGREKAMYGKVVDDVEEPEKTLWVRQMNRSSYEEQNGK